MKKSIKILFVILVVGLLLRTLAAHNAHLNPDELAYALTPVNIISTGKISTFHQSPAYFYLTDMAYSLFGVSALTSRLTGVVFASLTILVVFLLANEFFRNKKKSLIAAFLFAVSGYAIQFNTEMDGITIFFVLLSMLFYMKGFKKDEFYLLSALFLGLGLVNKPLAALLVPLYIGHYFARTRKFPKKRMRVVFYAALMVLIILMPIFSYNYLLYKEKNTVDIFFSSYLSDVNQNQYAGLGIDKPWNFNRFTKVAVDKAKALLCFDAIIFLLGILGLLLALKKKEKWTGLFISFIALYAIFLWGKGGGGSANHQVFFIPFLAIGATYTLLKISSHLRLKKNVLMGVLGIILIVNVISISDVLTEQSALGQLQDVARDFEEGSLVLVDERIYLGNVAWAFHDQNYITTKDFEQFVNQQPALPGEPEQITTYFIECVSKDCGWGRGLKDNIEIQQRADTIANVFQQGSPEGLEITDGMDTYKVLETKSLMKASLLPVTELGHWFYLYSVDWKAQGQEFDAYSSRGFLHKLGKVILWIDILLILGSIWFIFRYLFFR